MWLSYAEYHLRPVPGFRLIQPWIEAVSMLAWRRTGQPPPPRAVKAARIRRFASPARRTFVETGTFYGDTLAELRSDFDRLISIELSPRLAARARRRFARDAAVTILEGDSGALLGPALRSLARPAVVWLDGHYSGWLTARGESDTPVVREARSALEMGTLDDVLLVDDARLFGADPSYPSISELSALVAAQRPRWEATVEDDIISFGERAS